MCGQNQAKERKTSSTKNENRRHAINSIKIALRNEQKAKSEVIVTSNVRNKNLDDEIKNIAEQVPPQFREIKFIKLKK